MKTEKAKPFVMGCYGVGVSRLVAAVIEQNHDEKVVSGQKKLHHF